MLIILRLELLPHPHHDIASRHLCEGDTHCKHDEPDNSTAGIYRRLWLFTVVCIIVVALACNIIYLVSFGHFHEITESMGYLLHSRFCDPLAMPKDYIMTQSIYTGTHFLFLFLCIQHVLGP